MVEDGVGGNKSAGNGKLTCTGVAARITAPGSLGFGNVWVNSSSNLTLRITNTGTAPLSPSLTRNGTTWAM